jgi:hypothetical protein
MATCPQAEQTYLVSSFRAMLVSPRQKHTDRKRGFSPFFQPLFFKVYPSREKLSREKAFTEPFLRGIMPESCEPTIALVHLNKEGAAEHLEVSQNSIPIK